jgi:hypothetical protein
MQTSASATSEDSPMATSEKTGARRKRAASTVKRRSSRPATAKWSARVMQTSDAMDLQSGVFKQRSAKAVALSLKKSSEASGRRKGTPFQSAMSMLNFEINRAGKSLPEGRKRILNQAKAELRKLYGRPA